MPILPLTVVTSLCLGFTFLIFYFRSHVGAAAHAPLVTPPGESEQPAAPAKRCGCVSDGRCTGCFKHTLAH